MGKILGFRIVNYGVLKDVRMGRLFRDGRNAKTKDLGDLVAIIGENGAGKSSVADAFGFLSDCLTHDVEHACDAVNRCGFERLRSQGSEGPIRFEIYYREAQKSSPITYELAIDADKTGRAYVAEERLRQRRLGNQRGYPLTFLALNDGKGFVYEGDEGGENEETQESAGKKIDVELADRRKLGVVTLGAMKQYSRVEKFLAFLRNWYLCYFTPDAARGLQAGGPTPHLDRVGSNLNNVALYMFRENKNNFQKVLESIQGKIPGVQKIEPLSLPNGQLALQFFHPETSEPFYSPRMSDGTLKLFAYYLLLHEKTPRQLVFIEEPENGLYHRYLPDLATEMAKLAKPGKQIFITTHSPFFVNALTPDSVWVLVKGKDGFSTLKNASEFEFVPELYEAELPLGDLWRSEYFDD